MGQYRGATKRAGDFPHTHFLDAHASPDDSRNEQGDYPPCHLRHVSVAMSDMAIQPVAWSARASGHDRLFVIISFTATNVRLSRGGSAARPPRRAPCSFPRVKFPRAGHSDGAAESAHAGPSCRRGRKPAHGPPPCRLGGRASIAARHARCDARTPPGEPPAGPVESRARHPCSPSRAPSSFPRLAKPAGRIPAGR
jgi:hypothetical protein